MKLYIINNKIKGSNKSKGIYYCKNKYCKDLTKEKVIKFIKYIFKDK